MESANQNTYIDLALRLLNDAPQPVWTTIHIGIAVIVILALVALGVIIYRAFTAQSFSLGILGWTRNDPKVEALNAVARNKGKVLFMAKLFLSDVLYLFSGDEGSGHFKLHEMVTAILQGVSQAISDESFNRCAVLVPEAKNSRTLRALVALGYSEAGKEKMRFSSDTCAGIAFSTGNNYYCKDKCKDPNFKIFPEAKHAYSSFICIPLKAGTNVLGILQVDAEKTEAFSEDDIAHLELLGAQITLLLLWKNLADTRTVQAAG